MFQRPDAPHLEYVINPDEEFTGQRSAWFLGCPVAYDCAGIAVDFILVHGYLSAGYEASGGAGLG